MARRRATMSRTTRAFEDARSARLYRLRAAGLEPGDPVDGKPPEQPSQNGFTTEFNGEFA